MDLKAILQYDQLESKIFIPNEIFKDLKVLHSKGSSHVAFAYSYYYLINWLFRYCKYESIKIDVKMIKEVLGYHRDNKAINYIIKKNGKLDEIGYTMASSNYPIGWTYEDDLEFSYLNDIDPEMKKYIIADRSKNYQIKYPVKGLWRTKESQKEDYEDGTFFDISNTHLIPFEVFIYCMENRELGVLGFYLYSYLTYRCQWHDRFNSSVDRIGDVIGYSTKTTQRYLGTLLNSNLVDYETNKTLKVEGEYKRQPNTYKLI